MNTHSSKFKIFLGLFVLGGLVIFVLAIFIIGKQKNLFNPVFRLTTTFYNVGGLQVGNNIRFSGVNVGTVDNIQIINDTTVLVDMIIQKGVQQFIKKDCMVAIGSEGIIGDRVLIITQSHGNTSPARDGQQLLSTEPIETDAIMATLKVTADNSAVVTEELAQILKKINKGNGTLWKLVQDSAIAENINQTIVNLKKSSKGLDENMNAAKNTFLLKGYYRKKAKREAQKQKKAEAQKAIDINSNKR